MPTSVHIPLPLAEKFHSCSSAQLHRSCYWHATCFLCHAWLYCNFKYSTLTQIITCVSTPLLPHRFTCASGQPWCCLLYDAWFYCKLKYTGALTAHLTPCCCCLTGVPAHQGGHGIGGGGTAGARCCRQHHCSPAPPAGGNTGVQEAAAGLQRLELLCNEHSQLSHRTWGGISWADTANASKIPGWMNA